MVRFKLDKLLTERNLTMYRLHILTGIRPNTVSDIVNNRIKQVSVEMLDQICKALELKSITELIEYVDEGERKD